MTPNGDLEVYDYERDAPAVCPLMGKTCVTSCMLMRPTVLGEPRCSLRVIADETLLIASALRTKAGDAE